jgi:integral membrane protein (TIGR01906 family)
MSRLLAAALAALILLAVLCFATVGVGESGAFLGRTFQTVGSVAGAGVSSADAATFAQDVGDYLAGRRPALDRPLTIDGELRSECTEREQAHMADVKALFALARTVGGMALACVLALAAGLAVRRRRVPHRAIIGSGLLIGVALWAVLIGGTVLLAVLAGADFYAAFFRFHQLLFTNDLWLLNPQTDLLIRLMPTAFFEAIAKAIAALWLAALAVLLAVGVWLIQRRTSA